jgi:release factor glutamine methyltransferase
VELALDAGLSIEATRRALARAFRSRGLDTPDLDARLLTAYALGLDHTQLATAGSRHLTPEETDKVKVIGARRLNREPIARIVGRKEFWNLTLTITDAVLVPRPETETVVEVALSAMEEHGTCLRPLRILDIGTGSGALLLALLKELPSAVGIGTDRSLRALEVARLNAHRSGLGTRAGFVATNYGAALAGAFDLIVSNPPYIATNDLATLEPEVRDHDPALALDGGPDGLRCYEALAIDACRLLAPQAHLIVEIGANQSAAVGAVLTAAGLKVKTPYGHDLAGIPRALSATKIARHTKTP